MRIAGLALMAVLCSVSAGANTGAADWTTVNGESVSITVAYTADYRGAVKINGTHFMSIPPTPEQQSSKDGPFVKGYGFSTSSARTEGSRQKIYILTIIPTNIEPFVHGKNLITISYELTGDPSLPFSFFAMSKNHARISRRLRTISEGYSVHGGGNLTRLGQFIYGLRLPERVILVDMSAGIDQRAEPGKVWEMDWEASVDFTVAGRFAEQWKSTPLR